MIRSVLSMDDAKPAAAPSQRVLGAVFRESIMEHESTGRRLTEQMNESRLRLIEYAVDHTRNELMSRVLNGICELVESPIGFFRLVGPDQKSLLLQQWSTRTSAELRRVDEHWPTEQTGVWADCIRERAPVIHNGCASLREGQGMGEGYGEVIRELAVPIMRNGSVVAILGVGNKAAEYIKRDVEIVSYLSDVTWEIVERKRAEEALVDSEKRYRRLFESAKDGILILDAETGMVVDANPFLMRLLGYSYSDLCGKHIWDIGAFRDISSSQDAFRTLQENEYIRYDDLPLESVDGRKVEVEFVSNVYLVDHSRVIQCNIRDITERKRSEAERERLLLAIEQAGDMVVITDPGGRIQYVNPAFERVTGYTRQEAIGQNPRFLDSGKQPPGFYENLWQTISAGGVFRGRMINKRKNGTLFTEEATISPVRNHLGRIVSFVAVKYDITEHLRLTDQIQHAQRMESVGRLAGGVAHDYNNMLNVIIGYTELAMENVHPSEPVHADLKEILNAALRSAEITRQLLAFARRQTISVAVLDLNEIVSGMLKMLRRLIGEDIDLVWLPEANLWQVEMDAAQIDQILTNLCVNARDAIGGVGAVTIETHKTTVDEAYCADHVGATPGEFILLAVSDDGCGMDKETLGSIFEPFFTTKDVNRGTGLGLATIYGIVKQNDGFISVDSESDRGTTFGIFLPRHVGGAKKVNAEAVADIPSGHGELVLLVEDEPAILKMSQRMLESLGYRVLAAGAPGEALRLVGEHRNGIHLLVTDVIMPGMNGRDLAGQMHTICPDTKTLFMSGYTADVIAHRGVLEEGAHFIQKPFSTRDLGIKVRATLDQK